MATETDPLDFLHRLFDGRFRATERPAITAQMPDGKQPASPWPDRALIPQDTHISVGLFEANTPTVAREGFARRFDRCTGVIALLLDDVHEKVTAPKLQPTAIVQTKPGSEQWIYAFREPLRDLSAAAQAMDALIAAGHADPGGSAGKTACIRLGRLPGSDPKQRGIPARLVWADWSRRFVPDMALLFGPKGFDLPLPEKRALTASSGNVTILRAADDPFIGWLSMNGWLRGTQTASGWIPTRCPWSHEHTDGVETGTDVFVGRPLGWHCFHGACAHRKPVDALAFWAGLGAPLGRPVAAVDEDQALRRLQIAIGTTKALQRRWRGVMGGDRASPAPSALDRSVAFLLALNDMSADEIVWALETHFPHGACRDQTRPPAANRYAAIHAADAATAYVEEQRRALGQKIMTSEASIQTYLAMLDGQRARIATR